MTEQNWVNVEGTDIFVALELRPGLRYDLWVGLLKVGENARPREVAKDELQSEVRYGLRYAIECAITTSFARVIGEAMTSL